MSREQLEQITVALTDIEIPAQFRKPDPEKVEQLARSIERDGLLQPIGLCKGAEKTYRLVFGGHRLAAYQRLGMTAIAARLFELPPERAEAAMLAENVHRNPLSGIDYIAALKRWHELHCLQYPETVGAAALAVAGKKGGGGRKTAAAGPALPESGKAAPGPGAEPEGSGPDPAPARFDVAAAETLGLSPTTIRADVAIAKVLSASDIEILKGRGLTIQQLERLAKVADEPARKRAISLAASGMDVDKAIADAPENTSIERVEAADSGVKPEAEMTDDEWLAHYCAEALARIANQVAFRKDALAWRQTHGFLSDLRKKCKKALALAKGEKAGPFAYKLAAMLEVRHPNDWLRCGPCDGTGKAGNIAHCPSCDDNGYTVEITAVKHQEELIA